jgi:DNA-directed RNA polymerase specialized sigma24 family protein
MVRRGSRGRPTDVPDIAEVAAETISFGEFFEEHHRRLFSALCAATANRQEAEEVMQEAFLKLWERWDRVSGLEDPVGYLYRTAMNVFRKRLCRARGAQGGGAFRRGGSATCCDAGAPSEGRWVAYLIYALVIGGLGLLVLRRRAASRSPG